MREAAAAHALLDMSAQTVRVFLAIPEDLLNELGELVKSVEKGDGGISKLLKHVKTLLKLPHVQPLQPVLNPSTE